jgi:hypothetical protein
MQLLPEEKLRLRQLSSVTAAMPGARAAINALLDGDDPTGGLVSIDDQMNAIARLALNEQFDELWASQVRVTWTLGRQRAVVGFGTDTQDAFNRLTKRQRAFIAREGETTRVESPAARLDPTIKSFI